MISFKEVRAEYGRLICRKCLSKLYDVELLPKDCIYEYHYECPGCKPDQRIVSGLTASGKLKTLFK